MADVQSSETTTVGSSLKMKGDSSPEKCSAKQENNESTRPEEFKVCSPSNSFKSSSTNSFATDNKFGKSILKPSLLSVNSSSASNNFVLRQSSFNPFIRPMNEIKSDNSDKKQLNGETVKFVPLIKNDPQTSKSTEDTQSKSIPKPIPTASFVFGQNLQERVISDEALASTSSVSANGNSSTSNDMLFSSVIKNEAKTDTKEKEQKSLTESAREYEESRAIKRKYEEVQVKTGEEEETNILSTSCKLFAFDKISANWQERGRGTLRLNDFELDENQIGSRLVFRAAGSHRVILNTKIWAEMTIDKASDKSIRLTALDASGEVKVFLIMSSIEDSRQLYSHLQSRLEKEISLQKRKKQGQDDVTTK